MDAWIDACASDAGLFFGNADDGQPDSDAEQPVAADPHEFAEVLQFWLLNAAPMSEDKSAQHNSRRSDPDAAWECAWATLGATVAAAEIASRFSGLDEGESPQGESMCKGEAGAWELLLHSLGKRGMQNLRRCA